MPMQVAQNTADTSMLQRLASAGAPPRGGSYRRVALTLIEGIREIAVDALQHGRREDVARAAAQFILAAADNISGIDCPRRDGFGARAQNAVAQIDKAVRARAEKTLASVSIFDSRGPGFDRDAFDIFAADVSGKFGSLSALYGDGERDEVSDLEGLEHEGVVAFLADGVDVTADVAFEFVSAWQAIRTIERKRLTRAELREWHAEYPFLRAMSELQAERALESGASIGAEVAADAAEWDRTIRQERERVRAL